MEDFRRISQIFSTAMFRNIIFENNDIIFKNITKNLSYKTNLDIITASYTTLQKNYRCEYIYKNNVIVDNLKSVILDELKICKSKADLVVLNDNIVVYEIKTELDKLDKLTKQIKDYQKIAEKIYIVTDKKYLDKLKDDYKDTSIGIIILNDKNKLEIKKKAIINKSLLNFETIFKILRKQEYLDLVMDNFNIILNVPNTKIFNACYDILSRIPIIKFQKQVLEKLKKRKNLNYNLLKSPMELKHICNSLDFKDKEYNKLYNFLK